MQEAEYGVKDVASGKEAAEDLGVVAVQPLATEFNGVLAGQHGKGITDLEALEHLVHAGFEEEGLAKTEGGTEAHGGIGRNVGVHGSAGAVFTREAEVPFIDPLRGEGTEEVDVDG